MADIDALKHYERFSFSDGPWTREVFRRGSGPAVIIMHEIPGLHPLVIDYADRVAASGMTVFLPSLFGAPGKPVSNGYVAASMLANICIRWEFNVWANGYRCWPASVSGGSSTSGPTASPRRSSTGCARWPRR